MRIALIGPPFIEIPPRRYGGTELFIGNLARELCRRGEEVVVYGNGDSSLPCPVRWRYPHGDWPCDSSVRAQLKNADHTAWAIRDALEFADVIHLNDIVGLPFTMFTEVPTVLTIHHPHEPELSEQYSAVSGDALRGDRAVAPALASRCRASRSCITAFPYPITRGRTRKTTTSRFSGGWRPARARTWPSRRRGARESG